VIDAVPEIDDILGAPDEQALKGWDQEFSGSQLSNELHQILIPDAYLPVAVIQNAPPVKTVDKLRLRLPGGKSSIANRKSQIVNAFYPIFAIII
jgi:hypothetical protein